MPSKTVTYYVCDLVSGIVLDTLPLAGEVVKTRGEVESASWDLAIPDERVTGPLYVETQGEQLSPELVNLARDPSLDVIGATVSAAQYPHSGDISTKLFGSRSLRTDRTTTSPTGTISQVRLGATVNPGTHAIPVAAGQTLSMAVYARSSVDARARMQYLFRDAANAQIGSIAQGTFIDIAAGEWTRHVIENVTVPAGAAYFDPRGQITVRSGTTVGGEVAWWDGLMVNDGPTVHDYFDGDSLGCQWTGDPDASTSFLPATYAEVRAYRRNDAWLTLLQPWKVMIVAEWRGRLIQAWVLVSITLGNHTMPMQGASLERLLERVLVRDQDWLSIDLSEIAAGIVGQRLVPFGGWSIEWSDCGVVDDAFHELAAGVTVFSALETLQDAEGGPIWCCDVRWVPGQEGHTVEKIVRIGKRLGVVQPDAIFHAKPGEYTRMIDWSGDNGALEVWGTTEGQGMTETSFQSDKLAQGWHPNEFFASYADLDDEQLELRRDGRGRELEDGTITWEATLRIDEQPQLGADWNIGDTVTLVAAPGPLDPTGGKIVAELQGWALSAEDGTIVPRMVQEGEDEQ